MSSSRLRGMSICHSDTSAERHTTSGAKLTPVSLSPWGNSGSRTRIGRCPCGQAPPGSADDESTRPQPQRRPVQAGVDLDVSEHRAARQPQPGDPVAVDLTGQPRRRPPEQVVERGGRHLYREFHRSGHQHRGSRRPHVHVVQHHRRAVEMLVLPTDIACRDADVVELTYRKAAHVEPGVELRDGQCEHAVVESHREASADHQSAHGREQRPVGRGSAAADRGHGSGGPQRRQHVDRPEGIEPAERTVHDDQHPPSALRSETRLG